MKKHSLTHNFNILVYLWPFLAVMSVLELIKFYYKSISEFDLNPDIFWNNLLTGTLIRVLIFCGFVYGAKSVKKILKLKYDQEKLYITDRDGYKKEVDLKNVYEIRRPTIQSHNGDDWIIKYFYSEGDKGSVKFKSTFRKRSLRRFKEYVKIKNKKSQVTGFFSKLIIGD